MRFPPKIAKEELKTYFQEEIQLPAGITEPEFEADIQFNDKIQWRTNPFLDRRPLVGFFLNRKQLRNWRVSRIADVMIILGMIIFSVWPFNPWLILFLIVYPFLRMPYDHGIFIILLSVLILLDFIFTIPIPDFWVFMTFVLAGYVVRKKTYEMIEKAILYQAFSNFENFWRFYSNKLIWMEDSRPNDEYERLMGKYEDLVR